MLELAHRESRVRGFVLAYLDVLLQVLWTLEALAAVRALVWLQWNVYADVGGDVVTLDGCGTAVNPSTGQVQVVGRFAPDVALADVLIKGLGGLAALFALVPLTGEVVVAADRLAGDLCGGINSCWSLNWRRNARRRLGAHFISGGGHRAKVASRVVVKLQVAIR